MDVAKAMEKALEEIWYKEVDRFAAQFEQRVRKGPQSAMSSPSGFIDEVPDYVIDAMDLIR